jgi:signal transduction histidine kinase
MKVHFSEFDFSERAIFLVDFFTPEAIRKGLQFEFRKDQQIGSAIIWSDKDKLDAIMTNLIKNAIKYTNQGFIEFGYHFEEGQLILYVKDTGYGIPPERLQSIFDRFTQLHGGLKESFEGSGLGLAISKGYIDLLGGTITVESEVDKGSIFRVNVPVSLKNS